MRANLETLKLKFPSTLVFLLFGFTVFASGELSPDFWHALLKSTVSLFIIVDPIGNLPIFLSLTRDMDGLARKRAFDQAVLASFFILFVFAVGGDKLLQLFDVSIPAFQVAGGTLLFVISVKLLATGGWEEKQADPESRGIVPIAFPLIAGPGAITTVILIIQRYGVLVSFASILIVTLANFVILRNSELFFRVLGKTGSAVVSRIMAIFIGAIAVEYILVGAKNIFFKGG